MQEAKDLFNENYQNEKILHMVVSKYLINGKKYNFFEKNLVSDSFALEIKFKFISKLMTNDLDRVLENYQIKVSKYIDANYLKKLFGNNIELSEVAHRIIRGYNENEVELAQKHTKKLSFFEKFFQLFG